MMKIKVYLPPYLDSGKLDESGYLILEEGATLHDLFKELAIPFPAVTVKLCRVNYDRAGLKTRLKNGDVISFFSLIAGG